MTPAVRRRCEFLLLVASDPNEKRDQAVVYTMRVLSNHATIGRDALSEPIKRLNRTMSKRAFERLRTTDWQTFKSTTTNEHPKPLKQIWQWIVENAETLTVERIWQEFLDHPMITVTKEEDRAMPKSDGDFSTRYKGIDVINLDADPYSFRKK